MFNKQIKNIDDLLKLPVDVQFHVATMLAANCGYQLIAEDTERSLEIKAAINILKSNDVITIKGSSGKGKLLIEGLKALLK